MKIFFVIECKENRIWNLKENVSNSLYVRAYQLFESVKRLHEDTHMIRYKKLVNYILSHKQKVIIYFTEADSFEKSILKRNLGFTKTNL